MVCMTPPKEDKVDTSSAKVPMAQTLVARPVSKALKVHLGPHVGFRELMINN
jgi:hypothetical protein